MTVIGEATVAVKADTKGFQADAERGVGEGMKGALTKVGAAVAAAGIGRAFAGLLRSSVDEAREANKVAAQTAQVIKTTGGVAGVTADQVDALSSALSAKSGIDDDVIASSQAVLLTFTKVRNEVGEGSDVFNRASEAALDMSVALKTDLQGATLQLGKALNDPIKGITALSRSGVSFTEQQKQTIKSLVESGDVLSAQKIILDELATEFGGQAEAQATAADKARVGWANYKEEIGKRLVPVIDGLFTKFNEVLPAIQSTTLGVLDGIVPAWHRFYDAIKPVVDLAGAIGGLLAAALGTLGTTIASVLSPALDILVPQLGALGGNASQASGGMAEFIRGLEGKDSVVASLAAAIGGLGAAFLTVQAIGSVGSAIGGISSLFGGLGSVLGGLANPVGLVVAGIVALGVAAVVLYKNVKPVHDLFDTIGRFFRDTVWPVIKDVADAIGGPLLVALGASVALLNPFAIAAVAIAAGFKLAYEKIEPFRNAVDAVGRFLGTELLPILREVVSWIGDKLGQALDFITGTALPALGRLASTVGTAIASGIGSAVEFVQGLVTTIANAIGPIANAIGRWLGPPLAKVQQAGEEFLGWLNEHVVPTVVAAGEFFAAVWARISDVVSVAWSFISAVIFPVIEGIVNGLGILGRFLLDVVGPAFSALAASIGFAMGIIGDVIGTVLDVILSVVGAVLPTIVDLFGVAWETIKNVVVVVFDFIKSQIEAALSIIQGIFQVFTALLTGDWGKLWDGLVNILQGVIEFFKSIIDGGLRLLAAIISGTGEAIKTAFLGIWEGVKAGVSTLIEDIVGFFTGLPGRIIDLVGTIANAGLEIGKALLKGIADGISGAVGFVADIAGKLLEAVRNLVNTFVIDKLNAGIRGVFSLADRVIPDFVSDIGAGNAPQIDRLAAGGIVPATDGGRLALLAEGGRDEAVVPLEPGVLDGLRALANGQGVGATQVDASVTIMGNVYGVDDLDAYLDERDQRLAELLTARRGR